MLFDLPLSLLMQLSSMPLLATGHHMAQAQKCYYHKGSGPKTYFPCHAQSTRNSKAIVVNGKRVGDQFVVDYENEEMRYEGCVRSFAYWAPTLLQSDNLLNVETGKNIPVVVSIDNDSSGVSQSTTIELPKSSISLKYDSDGRWIELETRLKLFGKLSYKRTTI